MLLCLTQWNKVAIVSLDFNSDLMQFVTDFEVNIFVAAEVVLTCFIALAEQTLDEVGFSVV